MLKYLLIIFLTSPVIQLKAQSTQKHPRNISELYNNTPKITAAPKPPMGWNSWDNFGLDITESEFKKQVDYVAANLKSYGYEYMVIDAGWYAPKHQSFLL